MYLFFTALSRYQKISLKSKRFFFVGIFI